LDGSTDVMENQEWFAHIARRIADGEDTSNNTNNNGPGLLPGRRIVSADFLGVGSIT